MENLEENKRNANDNYLFFNNSFVEKINLKDFEIGEKLTRCNYGYISYCKKIRAGQIYSLKVLKKKNLLENKFVERQYNEYANLSCIYHPFIIELRGINFTDPYNLYYLFEFLPGGPLKYYIKLNKNLPIEHAKFYIACLITVLDYLHKKNIIHRDIRPENILINNNGYLKLAEFNFSKKINNKLTYTICGSPEYYSPEMINKAGYNKCIDFWQIGILLYEIITGATPFVDTDPVKIYKKINKGKINFPKNINKNAKMIIKQFLNIDKNKRLGCTKKGIYEIIENPFFKDFDWEGLLHRKLEPPFIPNISKFSDIVRFKRFEDTILEEKDEPLPKENDPFFNWQ